jgi:hypothetical protein
MFWFVKKFHVDEDNSTPVASPAGDDTNSLTEVASVQQTVSSNSRHRTRN